MSPMEMQKVTVEMQNVSKEMEKVTVEMQNVTYGNAKSNNGNGFFYQRNGKDHLWKRQRSPMETTFFTKETAKTTYGNCFLHQVIDTKTRSLEVKTHSLKVKTRSS